jgi:hypothetical protein
MSFFSTIFFTIFLISTYRLKGDLHSPVALPFGSRGIPISQRAIQKS